MANDDNAVRLVSDAVRRQDVPALKQALNDIEDVTQSPFLRVGDDYLPS